MPEKKDEWMRTTVRLSKTLHQRLREAASRFEETSESLIAIAIEHELEARGLGELEAPKTWGPLLAQRFLECLPTPVVIKDSEARIIWCNFAYEELFGRPRGHLLNFKITELGLLEKDSAVILEQDIKAMHRSRNASDAMQFWEPLTLPARGGVTTLFRAHRFVFRPQHGRGMFLGDISFDWGQILPGYPREPSPDLLKGLRWAAVTDGVGELFQPFLAACPAAIAIKDAGTNMLWCNTEYELLAKQKLNTIVGQNTRRVFGLSDVHPIVQNEFTVAHSNVWMYAAEELPDRNPRTSLRFPIIGAGGRSSFIGVVSAEFRQEDIRSHTPHRQRRRAR
jgi:PAS domain-containing protein